MHLESLELLLVHALLVIQSKIKNLKSKISSV